MLGVGVSGLFSTLLGVGVNTMQQGLLFHGGSKTS